MQTFEIWSEGYAATGEYAQCSFLGNSKGNTFKEAVINFIEKNPNHSKDLFDENRLTYWSCRLFPTKEEASKSFG